MPRNGNGKSQKSVLHRTASAVKRLFMRGRMLDDSADATVERQPLRLPAAGMVQLKGGMVHPLPDTGAVLPRWALPHAPRYPDRESADPKPASTPGQFGSLLHRSTPIICRRLPPTAAVY